MSKLVFVEDDPDVGELIREYLGRHDITVIVEPRGDKAEATIFRENPDLVLLDVMLPGKDGLTLCRDLRRSDWPGPIVLFTSLDSDMNHILALEIGAHDYLLKTTPPSVLLARLRLHLRQSRHFSPTVSANSTLPKLDKQLLQHGTLHIDAVNREVILDGKLISLSTTDFDLLWEFASNPGKILKRELLLKTLRGIEYDGQDRSIDIAISRLRRKLNDDPIDPYRIKTIRNKGYLFAPNAWESDQT